MITMLSRSVIWADLCLLSRRLCNLPANKAKYWHLYVASNSMSPRLVLPSDAMPNHVVPDEEYNNEWRGYTSEAHLNQVTWYTSGENPSSLQAVKRAGKRIRDLRIAEVTEQDVQIEKGKVKAFRVRMKLSFKYEGD